MHTNVTKLDANIHAIQRKTQIFTLFRGKKNHKQRNGYRENITKDIRTSNAGGTQQASKGRRPVKQNIYN